MIDDKLSFTGERFIPSEQGEIRIEHLQRYIFTLDLVTKKRVLDLACGEGYGSFLISGAAKQVIGVDVSDVAVRHATTKYAKKHGNLKFQKCSATNLPFQDGSFDVVVSFETIEHLAEQMQMVAEIRRVLSPQGVMVISSPNRPIYSDVGRYQNEFHVKELDFNELDSILSAHFPVIRYFGQRLVIGSAVMPVYETSTQLRVLGDDGDALNPLIGRLPDPVYFIAVCSSSEAGLPILQASILLPEKRDLLKKYLGYATWAQKTNEEFERVRDLYTKLDQEHHKVGAWAQSLDQEIKALNLSLNVREGQIANLNQVVGKRDDQIGSLSAGVAQRDVKMASLNQCVAEREHQIAALNKAVLEREGQIANLNQIVGKRDDQIGCLSAVVAQRDVQMASLNQGVADREHQIAALNKAVLEREGQITNLNQVVGKRDDQIDSLNAVVSQRDVQMASLNQSVADREHQIAALNKAVLEREGQIANLNQVVGKRDDQIDSLNAVVSQRDVQMASLNQSVADREHQIAALNKAVLEREGQIANLNQVVGNRDDQIDSLNAVVAQRDVQMASLNQSVADREHQIAALNKAVMEREGQIANLKQVVGNRDDQIDSLNAVVAQRDLQMASLNQSVAEREQQIAVLNTAMLEREGQINKLNKQVNELNDETVRRGELGLSLAAELASVRTLLAERESKVSVLQATLSAVTHSYCWRLTAPVRGFQWMLPTIASSFNRLPISRKTKDKIAFTTFERMPSLFRSLDSYKSWQLRKEWIAGVISNAIPLKTSFEPIVSVIIPVYGQIDFTLRCLDSIGKNPPKIAIEVLVIDDCSPDDSVEVLSQRQGIRLIKNKRNQGFIRSCNRGAAEANGEYLHFLNNDTEVMEGWLDALYRTFHEFPGTGLAGSKLIYPDGRLQEAGGIIWQDGSAWNFGRFQDASLPVYNYAREVDYCSGASIMAPKRLFDELGRFDEHYLPAYCEDADLALKMRDKGYRVIYQPMSTVIHFEGISSGTDLSQGAKAYQVDNTRKLLDRWKTVLLTYQANGTDVNDAKDRMATRRVLVLDSCTPTPNQDAGSVTTLNLMLILREMKFQVTFIPEDNFLYMPGYTTDLQRVGIEVLYAPYLTSVKQHLCENGNRYDLIFIFRPGVFEKNIADVRNYCSNAKVLFHTIDLHYLRMEREAALQSDQSKFELAREMKNREISAIKAADATIVHSTAEYDMLHPELPEKKLYVFPLILNVIGTKCEFAERNNIVFVGGYQHVPNIDAVKYFVQDIMPHLRRKLPGVIFYAVGSKPPAEVLALSTSDVIITGFIDDLTPLLDKMRVSVAPLRFGAGIKGKIGTAMAVGLPVVATSLATEGMSLTDGDNILVADDAEAFANTVVELYNDKAMWQRISSNGVVFANMAWGAESAWRILAEILSDLNNSFKLTRTKRPLTLYVNNNFIPSDDPKIILKEKVLIGEIDEVYKRKIQQEIAIFEKQVNVHDLPGMYHYWSNKYLAPIFGDAGFSSIVEFFSANFLAAANKTGSALPQFVSIGAGNCDLEVAVARKLVKSGFNNFFFDCLEINTIMLDRGKIIAEENDVLKNMRFVEADFNTWVASEKYDAVMANQSLHHVTRLEHLFDQIKIGLHDRGSFIISDMIGRNGHQRWPESLEIVNKFWEELPNSYKYNALLNRFEDKYENWDCSKEGFEGIRAQDVLPLLVQRFECERFIGFGNVIDIFVDRCFGHNFNPESEWDRVFIDRVHNEDEAGLLAGTLTPTHMIAVFVNELTSTPYFSRGISPDSSIRLPRITD